MGVLDGQPVSAAVTNPAFINKNIDDTTPSKLGLNNSADVTSGTQVINTQKEINSLDSFVGKAHNAAATALPPWTNNDVGTPLDPLFQRTDAITIKFSGTTGIGHEHTGADGDGPQLQPSSLYNVNLRGYGQQGINVNGATGGSTDVSSQFSSSTPSAGFMDPGVVVTPPYNECIIRNANNGDEFVDGSGNVVYARLTNSGSTWTLTYYVRITGTETPYTFPGTVNVSFYYQLLANPLLIGSPVYDPAFFIPSANSTADVLPATTTQQGKVLLSSSAAQPVGSSNTIGTTNGTVANADHAHQGVHSIAASGHSQIFGDPILAAGSGVSLSQSGSIITISASGASGGGGGGSAVYWSGYNPGGAWDTSSTTFTDPTLNSGDNSIIQRVAAGLVVTAEATTLPAIVFTPDAIGNVYYISAITQIYNQTATEDTEISLTDGTTIICTGSMQEQAGTAAGVVPVTIQGYYVSTSTSPVTIKIQLASPGGSIGHVGGFGTNGASIEWAITQIAAPVASGTSAVFYSGYMPVGAQWSTTSSSFTDPTNLGGGNTLVQRVGTGITVSAAAGTTAGITFTPVAGAAYRITASCQIFNGTNGNDCDIRLFDGTTEITTNAMQGNGTDVCPVTLIGHYVPGVTTPVTVKVQIAASSAVGTAYVGFAILAKSIEWTVEQLSAPAANTSQPVWSGYQNSTGGAYTATSTPPTYIDFVVTPNSASQTAFVETLNNGMGTVTSPVDGNGNPLPQITFTPPSTGVYEISASSIQENGSPSSNGYIALWDGTIVYDESMSATSTGGSDVWQSRLVAMVNVTTVSPITMALIGAGSPTSVDINGSSFGVNVLVYWTIKKVG